MLLNVVQGRLMSQSSGRLSDDWSVGYMGGFADASLQYKNIGTDDRGIAIMLSFFEKTFGPGNGGEYYFKKYVALQGSVEAMNGQQVAGTELFEWMEGKIQSPLGLSSYCNNCLDKFKEGRAQIRRG